MPRRSGRREQVDPVGDDAVGAQVDEPLRRPLAQCRVAIVTTAAPYQPDKGDQGPRAPYNAAAKFYKVYSGDTSIDHDLRISHVAIDRKHTTAEDSGTYFPLAELRRLVAVSQQRFAAFRRFLPGTDSPCGVFDRAVIEAAISAHGAS